ncbi:hypothetical protein KIW84_074509 [Lathyrus oleraceus]|uniref:NOMO seventh transthyretin-like domain-containing protein n=1 Tax=Pisum sativum TaxID=3888 RepID=A0A9D4VUB2_PEA|nr:hypothetical protein KIW84_074509 [Pisum sativum]
MASIEDIVAVSYDICGLVRMVSSSQKAMVIPGEYRLSAIAATPDNAVGLMFAPSYIDVEIKSPLLNVEFSQALVNVRGVVVCKEECDPSVSVTIVRQVAKHNEARKTISLTSDNSEFLFSDVISGKYRLEVKHNSSESVTKEDNWCWEKSFIDVSIGAEDLDGIVFVQKGYWVNVISTHDVNGYINQPDGSTVNLKIQKGSQHICVEFPDIHEFNFIDSCIFFGSSSVKIDTSNLLPIHLKGEKHLIKGQINVHSGLHDALPEKIVADIYRDRANVADIGQVMSVLNYSQPNRTNIPVTQLLPSHGKKSFEAKAMQTVTNATSTL